MQLRVKFILLALVPLLVAIAAMAAVVHFEARALVEAQLDVIQPVMLPSQSGPHHYDVAELHARLDGEAARTIRNTMGIIAGIAAVAAVLVTLSALMLDLPTDAGQRLRELARQVMRSQEVERGRVAHELQDDVSQGLVSVKFQLESVLARTGGDETAPETQQQTAEQQTLARNIAGLNEMLRNVRRISHGLRPALLDKLGLVAALTQALREFGLRTGIDAQIDADTRLTIPDELGTALFRVVQEALNNIERHAGASQVRVRMAHIGQVLVLMISDNGHGFDANAPYASGNGGLGRCSMRERVETFGGRLTIVSSAQGTELKAVLPASALKE